MQVDVDPDDLSNRDKPPSRNSEMNIVHNTQAVLLLMWKANAAIRATDTTVFSRLIPKSRLNGFSSVNKHMVIV
jgi:spore coat polysaccharide biosynthesis predicted glycosyltransferase SpsG